MKIKLMMNDPIVDNLTINNSRYMQECAAFYTPCLEELAHTDAQLDFMNSSLHAGCCNVTF